MLKKLITKPREIRDTLELLAELLPAKVVNKMGRRSNPPRRVAALPAVPGKKAVRQAQRVAVAQERDRAARTPRQARNDALVHEGLLPGDTLTTADGQEFEVDAGRRLIEQPRHHRLIGLLALASMPRRS